MGAAVSVTILIGDVRDRLRGMADESVDCVITSPPYWGLRDYDVEGQIGMEPTLAEHLAAEARAIAAAGEGAEAQEGIDAFLARRKADFLKT